MLTPKQMKQRLLRWWNRKWSKWELHIVRPVHDINYRRHPWKRVTVLKQVSNDGLVRYKKINNY